MENNFVPAIVALRNSDLNGLLAKLQIMFQSITKMDADEVVTAYQTTHTATRVAGINSDDPILYDLFRAMTAHMVFLASQNMRRDQKARFAQVTGRSDLFEQNSWSL